MTTNNYDVWASIARDIAAEKRPAPKPENLQAALIDKMKAEIVRARLALAGITDESKVAAVTKRVRISESGDLIGLDQEGRPGVGTGDNYTMTVDDVVRDVAADPVNPGKDSLHNDVKNPFVKGPFYSITEQMLLLKNDPERAEFMQYQASIGRA